MESETLSGTRQIINFIIDDWKLLLFLTIIFALYFHYTSTFDHFQKRGVKFMKPRIFVGNIGKRIIGTQSFLDFQLDVYHQFKGCRYAGVFEGRRPLLYLLDPELIKAVTIRDFDNFMDRSMFNFKEPRYLSRSLLRLKGSVWKEVRSTLTPTFSSARLKHMLPLIELCSKQMVDYLQKFDGKDVEMKETMGHFTLEVIGASAFGIKSDALSDEKSHFVKMAEKLFIMPVSTRIVIYFSLMFYPPLMRFFNISFINKEATTTLIQMLKDTKAERKQSGQKKNDFLQLLIDAGEKERSEVEKGKEVQLDDDTIDAQSLLFLMAGYETSSTLLSFAIHILATKPEIQKKLREHIKEKTEGKEMSYDLLSELTYLEGFLLETLRVYPPVARLERMCTKNYVLPGTNLEVKKGEMIAIPVIGIHMDPEIYEDPTEFKPERFIGDAKREIPPHLYLAFGSGPRNCIGLRFAMYSAKTAMVHLLKNFEFQVCPKTEDPVKIHKRAVLLKAESGIWIKLNKL